VISKTLISIVGPTAIGKTSLAIKLANQFDTEIISADSRQFFKEMQIGTAVPTNLELESATHHFIQHKSVANTYSVGDFEKEALQRLEELFKTNDTLIMVGGSGLYVDAVTKGLDSFPEIDSSIRESLNKKLQENGLQSLQEQLKELDPIYYEKVDLDNPHRLIRALEVCIGSGLPYSSFIGQPKPKRPFHVITVGIKADREIIYDRINQRVDIMMQEGLLSEVKCIYEFKNLNALQTVGYRELFKHLDGEWDLDFAISEIKKNTRRFAKRQQTWFKKNQDTLWVNHDADFLDIVDVIKNKQRCLK
jgi:tRNA dimethylallyltransferase